MPNRIIKESINESRGLSECSMFAIDLYKRLISYADDYGRFNSDTTIMRARLYPREYQTVTEDDIIDALSELAGVGKIQFYTPQIFNQAGKKGVYGAFPNWKDHQRVRESKAKCPAPGDTSVNDWYLRRFVPLAMKAQVLERDNFKCQICGKFVTSCRDARRFVKLGSGLYHIDHIVPVYQGGRATPENLRVTCPECNLKRSRMFDFQSFLDETLRAAENSAATRRNLRQSAENCGLARAHTESNPIQSNPNPDQESNTIIGADAPSKKKFVPPTLDDVIAYCQERNSPVDPKAFFEYFDTGDWKDSKGQPVRNWKQKLLTWEKHNGGFTNGADNRLSGPQDSGNQKPKPEYHVVYD